MIKYLGSKRKLIPEILRAAGPCGDGNSSFLDLFSGTSRVGHAFKERGFRVISNDSSKYAHVLGTCYVQTDLEDIRTDAERLIRELNALPGADGYVTETFCRKSRFFQPKNGSRIDSIREEIERKCLDPELRSVVITALMEAADRVDSTTGLQMAYLKNWAPRSYNDLELRMPNVLPRSPFGKGLALCQDARDVASSIEADVVYIDPPYNQHSYLANYHIWESIALWDKPESFGVAQKRIDVRSRKSDFNSKLFFAEAMFDTVTSCKAKKIIVSFSNEGYMSKDSIVQILSSIGTVSVHEISYDRYVGSKIGVHGPSGKKVGKVSHTKNVEYIFTVLRDT